MACREVLFYIEQKNLLNPFPDIFVSPAKAVNTGKGKRSFCDGATLAMVRQAHHKWSDSAMERVKRWSDFSDFSEKGE